MWYLKSKIPKKITIQRTRRNKNPCVATSQILAVVINKKPYLRNPMAL